MFSAFSTTCFVLAAAAIAAGGAYGLAAGNDQGGSALFFVLAVAAALLGVVAAALGARDVAVSPSAAADSAPVRRPVDRVPGVRPSSWPLLAALALGLFAAGLATDAPLLAIGLIAVIVASLGWLAQSWREHPAWNPLYSERINDRYVVPIVLPVGVLVAVAIGAVSVSRLLLAVSEKVAPLIATVVAIAILGVFALLATRPMARSASLAFAIAGTLFVAGSGIGGAVAGEREFHQEGAEHAEEEGGHGSEGGGGGGESVTVELVAASLKFDKSKIEVPAHAKVTVHLVNDDPTIPHNVSFYEEKGGKAIVEGEIFDGGTSGDTSFESPDEGEYYFQCDVHPNMNGELVVA